MPSDSDEENKNSCGSENDFSLPLDENEVNLDFYEFFYIKRLS